MILIFAREKSFNGTDRFVVTTIGSIEKQAVVFLFELFAVKVAEEQIAPQIEALAFESRRIFRGTLAFLECHTKGVFVIYFLALFQNSEHAILKSLGVELSGREILQIGMILTRAS